MGKHFPFIIAGLMIFGAGSGCGKNDEPMANPTDAAVTNGDPDISPDPHASTPAIPELTKSPPANPAPSPMPIPEDWEVELQQLEQKIVELEAEQNGETIRALAKTFEQERAAYGEKFGEEMAQKTMPLMFRRMDVMERLTAAEKAAAPVEAPPAVDPIQLTIIKQLNPGRLRHWELPSALAVSPDGKWIATVAQGIVVLWDAGTGKLRWTAEPDWVCSELSFSPDSKTLAGASDSLEIWNVADGKRLKQFDIHAGYAAFGGKSGEIIQVIDSDQDELVVVDSNTGAALERFPSGYRAFASPGGRFSAYFNRDKELVIYDLEQRKQLAAPKISDEDTPRIAIHPSGSLVAVDSSGKLDVWDISTGAKKYSREGYFYTCCFTPDGSRLVCADAEKTYALDASSGELKKEYPVSMSGRMAFGADPNLVYGTSSDDSHNLGNNRGIHCLNLTTGRDTLSDLRSEAIICAAFSPSGKLFASGGDRLTIRDTESWEIVHAETLPDGKASAVAWDPDESQVAFYTTAFKIGVYDLNAKVLKMVCEPYQDKRYPPLRPFLAYTTDGKELLFGDRELFRYELEGSADPTLFTTVAKFPGAYASQARLMAFFDDESDDDINGMTVVDFQGQQRSRFASESYWATALADDGSQLAVADEYNITLFDLPAGKKRFSFRSDRHDKCEFDPTGSLIAAAGHGVTEIWSTQAKTKKPLAVIDSGMERGYYFQLAFSPDGKTLAVVNGDGSLTIAKIEPAE